MDYAAATPCDKKVIAAMAPFWNERHGNAGSAHREGVAAKEALTEARSRIAGFLGAHSDEIIFTSGGTEANNLAIRGVVAALEQEGRACADMHLVTSAIEHPSVLDIFAVLERRGTRVTYLDVNADGLIDLKAVEKVLTPQTILVSLMYVNNEIGTVQPIPKLAKIIRTFRESKSYQLKAKSSEAALPLMHTDASQAPLYCNCSVNRLGVDMMTLDAAKMHGPKGAGFLYRKRGTPLAPLMYGGHQEFGLRPGTENVPLAVGCAEALLIAGEQRENETARLVALRDYFIDGIVSAIPNAELNGSRVKRSPAYVNVSIPGLDAEYFTLVLDANGVAAGTRSACLSADDKPSYVISALRKSDAHARAALRFTLGRGTTKQDIDRVLAILKSKIPRK